MNTLSQRSRSDILTSGYLFVDNARFLSILSIVLIHTDLFSRKFTFLEGLIIQLRGFGVITFFIISAFLMASKLSDPRSSRFAYWKNRLERLGKPWAVWLGIYVGLDIAKQLALGRFSLADLPSEVLFAIFYAAFWYVPMILFSLAVLLVFWRYWDHLWFGAILLIISLIHGVNQYFRWFPHDHTVAFFGFLFYLWLGVQIYRNFGRVQAFIAKLPWSLLLAIAALAYGVAVAEAQLILRIGYLDAYNALKVSNQIYAMVVLAVLIKLPVRLVPSFIQVRKESYGIYLTHLVVASLAMGLFDLMIWLLTPDKSFTFFDRLPEVVTDPWERVGIWLAWFTVIYTLALLLTKTLRQTRLAWIVGAKE